VERLSSVESFGVGDTETRMEDGLCLPLPGRNFAAAVVHHPAVGISEVGISEVGISEVGIPEVGIPEVGSR